VTTASIKEVAKLAGVSIATVSRCMNNPEQVAEKTRIRVQDAILKTGYTPNTLARSFRRGRTNIVMVVLPSIGDPFFERVMQGIRVAARAKGYSIIINEMQFNSMTADEIAAVFVSRQTDGIILLASMSPFGTEVLSAKSHRALPIVIGCETISPELAAFPSVHIDNVAAAKEATAYLVSQGHERIGLICGSATSLLPRTANSVTARRCARRSSTSRTAGSSTRGRNRRAGDVPHVPRNRAGQGRRRETARTRLAPADRPPVGRPAAGQQIARQPFPGRTAR
jgi:DNA-binding LacI/PurR family transcriptional regulator